MVLVAQPLSHHLEELLGILLLPADPLPESFFQRPDERCRGNGFFVDRALI
jgi:hypothetical protein